MKEREGRLLPLRVERLQQFPISESLLYGFEGGADDTDAAPNQGLCRRPLRVGPELKVLHFESYSYHFTFLLCGACELQNGN